jgi:long-subunit fatty acid transport protein
MISLLLVSLLSVLCSCFLDCALAQPLQRIEIPSSPNPVGSGARALGMGGAFIAVADDATAASWNPGGLVQLEKPEVSIVGQYFHRIEDNNLGTNPEASGDQSVADVNLNYLSAVYPFTLFNLNMVVSLNHQYLFDFSREWNFPLFQSSAGLSINQSVDFDQKGDLSALGIAYAIQLTPRLSFGFTLNMWDDWFGGNEWKQTISQRGTGTFVGSPFIFHSASHDRFTFSGFNANLGLLWFITPKLTLGAVLKTPFTADVERESTFSSAIRFPTVAGADTVISSATSEDLELDMPMVSGIGLAYRFSDQLTVSADITRTEWDDFLFEDSLGNEFSPISGLPKDESDIDPTHQFRIGAEFLFIQQHYVIPLRGGFFYDPAPAEGSPDDFFGISLGSGFARGRFVFDLAYQYRFGSNVGSSILQDLDFSQDVDEHSIFASIIVHF